VKKSGSAPVVALVAMILIWGYSWPMMKIGLRHAHPFDFAIINGRFAWEILFERLEAELNMQMDVGNCLSGGGDPIVMLEKFPNRTWTIHLKEHKDKTFDSDWYQKVFNMCETNSTTQWYIVEMGGLLGNGFKPATTAIKKLSQLRK